MMKAVRLGLAVLAAALIGAVGLSGQAAHAAAPAKPAGAPEITKEQRAQGMKDAPKLTQAAGLPCQVADARFVGSPSDPKTKTWKYYEVACTGAVGYVLVDEGGGKTTWATCPEQARTSPDGKPNPGACWLPANLDDRAVIQPYVAKAGSNCQVSNVRGIGHGDTAVYFEVACQGGRGYVLKTSSPPKLDQPATLITCLAYDASSPVACKLSTAAAQLGLVDQLAAQSGKNCQVKDKRYMLTSEDSSNYYEVACQDGKGYVLQEGPKGNLVTTIDCMQADRIGDGCRLTNVREAETAQLNLYTKLARSAGYACDVKQYAPFSTSPPGHEVVELACSNRPDGAVAVFSAQPGEPGKIYDCAHSELAHYRCSFTQPDAAFPKLTDDLKKVGKTTCAVSGARTIGISKEQVGYIEVACADGAPGFIVSYDVGTLAPKEAVGCALAAELAGGCKLPANQRHS